MIVCLVPFFSVISGMFSRSPAVLQPQLGMLLFGWFVFFRQVGVFDHRVVGRSLESGFK